MVHYLTITHTYIYIYIYIHIYIYIYIICIYVYIYVDIIHLYQSQTLTLKKVFVKLKFSPALFEKILSFLCLVFKTENKWILKWQNLFSEKTGWFKKNMYQAVTSGSQLSCLWRQKLKQSISSVSEKLTTLGLIFIENKDWAKVEIG